MIGTIASFAKPQPDTILAIFMLRKFGETAFPGIKEAKLEFWNQLPPDKTAEQLEQEGVLLIDLGHGRFDHHRELENGKPMRCTSEIVADFLKVQDDPALKKLLAYAKRDDLEGKGTISDDPLDRAFGLSGLLTNLVRAYGHDLNGVVNLVLTLFEAHYLEEEKRTKLLPAEWKQLVDSGAAKQWNVTSSTGLIRVAQVPSDNPSLSGWLRAYLHQDLVIIRRSSNHVSIITNQAKKIDLSRVMANLREMEARKTNPLAQLPADLTVQGRISEVPNWYYDTMANTLQNGGAQTEGIQPTLLSDEEIHQAVVMGLHPMPTPTTAN